MNCTVIVTAGNDSKKITCEYNYSLYGALLDNGLLKPHIENACAGRGLCGKCLVLVSGRISEPTTEERFLLGEKLEQGYRLACCCLVRGDASVTINTVKQEHESKKNRYGFAVDVGTSVISVALCSITDEAIISRTEAANPQAEYGVAVKQRIEYAASHGTGKLTACTVNRIDALMSDLALANDIQSDDIERVYISGNTCMQNIVAGIDITPLGEPPFMPLTRDALLMSGQGLCFAAAPKATVEISGAINGNIGGNAICNAVATGIYKSVGPVLIVDIGSTVNLIIGNRNIIMFRHVDIPPVFEGDGITFGSGLLPGAVWHIARNRYSLHCSTHGNAKCSSVYGSALIDAVSIMLSCDIIDKNGTLKPKEQLSGAKQHLVGTENGESVFYLNRSHSVYITQNDIYTFMRAKAAVIAAIYEMLSGFDITGTDDIAAIYFTGCGTLTDITNAVRIGLLPADYISIMHNIGNTSLEGAAALLGSARARAVAEHIRTSGRVLPDETSCDDIRKYMYFGKM